MFPATGTTARRSLTSCSSRLGDLVEGFEERECEAEAELKDTKIDVVERA
jgi:hypothetical protein